MSFETYEESRYHGGPQTLYRFTYGTNTYGYTDAAQPVTHSTIEYQPIPIDRPAISSSGTTDKATLGITLPIDCDVARIFRGLPPSSVVWLTIFQGHDQDPSVEFMTVWSGRVLSGSTEGSVATLNAEPVSTAMKRVGLRRRYQYGCPHVLYGASCGANKAAHTVSATVASNSGGTITLDSGWEDSFEKADFLGGVVEFVDGSNTTIRTVLRVNSTLNQITVSAHIAGLGTGDTVALSLGCNHLMSGCNVFDNIQNFGGQPWIPKKHPLGFINQYY